MRSPLIAASALALAAVVGCSSKERVTPRQAPPVVQQRDVEDPTEPTQADLVPVRSPVAEKSTAQLLADKAAAYSREQEAHLAERQARPRPAPATANEPQVAWTDKRDDTAPAGEPQPTAAPTANNQVALITPPPPRSNDLPIIVPEGEDVPGQTTLSEAVHSSDQLLQQLAMKVRDNPKDVAAQLDYQLLQLVRGERVPHMPTLAGMSAEDREVVTAILDGLSNFRANVQLEQNQLMNRKVRPLVEMADRLKAQSDLALPNAALCTRVDGFGVYEPISPARFTGAREHHFIIYCEVENFASQLNDKKLWETRLSHEAILYTETGLNVWSEKADSIVDLSRNRRHDFFIVKKTRFPANMPIGRYVLKLSVTDQQSNRVAETTVPVQIVAQ